MTIVFFMLVAAPALVYVAYCLDYVVDFASAFVWDLVAMALSIGAVFIEAFFDISIHKIVVKVLLAVSAPGIVISSIYFAYISESSWVILFSLVSASCMCSLAINAIRFRVISIAVLVLTILLSIPAGLLNGLVVFFSDFGYSEVVQSIDSPNKQMIAEVIVDDEGALGGDTRVTISERRRVDLLVLQISKKPQNIYRGEWGEEKRIEVYWKDDSCLVINSKEYIVP